MTILTVLGATGPLLFWHAALTPAWRADPDSTRAARARETLELVRLHEGRTLHVLTEATVTTCKAANNSSVPMLSACSHGRRENV